MVDQLGVSKGWIKWFGSNGRIPDEPPIFLLWSRASTVAIMDAENSMDAEN